MKTLKILPLLFVLLMAACTKGPVDPPNDNTKTCAKKGKFETAVCGWGIYEQMWIRLDNGMLLQPCKSSVAMLDKSQIYEGREVELNYDILDKSAADCNALTTCLAWPGEFKSINITCIKLLGKDKPNEEPKNCEVKGKIERVVCGLGVFENYWIRLDNGTLLKPCQSDIALDINTIYEGMPVELSYYGIKSSMCPESTLDCFAEPPPHETVRVTCLKPLKDEKPECQYKYMGILYDWHGKLDGCGWVIKLNDDTILEVLDSDMEGRNLDDGTPVLLDYSAARRGSICMAGIPIVIKCIKVANTTN